MNKKIAYFLLCSLLIWLIPLQSALADDGLSLYITADGDTATDIARLSGLDVELIAAINDIGSSESLPAGTALFLPQQPLRSITVEHGDTIWSLAAANDTTVEQLTTQNELDSAAHIYTGQKLLIPLDDEVSVFAGSGAEDDMALTVLASRLGGSVSYIWPTDGVITSVFGWRSRGYHSGLDIAADLGNDICAAASGYVTEADWKNDSYGFAVMVEHDQRSTTVYGHASELLVEEGDYVRQGEVIARIGSTGNSTGPHLHFEIRINGECCDPLEYLPQKL